MSEEAPTGLPKPRTKKEDPNAPKSLPAPAVTEIKRAGMQLQEHLDRARKCTQCGEECRIVSNANGVNAFCRKCKRHWPISAVPLIPVIPVGTPRGFHKETQVEPDWNIAFDRDIGE